MRIKNESNLTTTQDAKDNRNETIAIQNFTLTTVASL